MRSAVDRPFCVYVHLLDGASIYVGCGSEARAHDMKDRTDRWHDRVAGREVEVKILRRFADRSEALQAERNTIRRRQPECNVAHHKANMRAFTKVREAEKHAIRNAALAGMKVQMVLPAPRKRRYL